MAHTAPIERPERRFGPWDYWMGEGPLWRLYWIYGVGVSTLGALIILAMVLAGLVGPLATMSLIVIGALYTVWVLVSVWRCAFNIATRPLGIEPEVWGWLARLLTFGWAINVIGLSAMVLQMSAG